MEPYLLLCLGEHFCMCRIDECTLEEILPMQLYYQSISSEQIEIRYFFGGKDFHRIVVSHFLFFFAQSTSAFFCIQESLKYNKIVTLDHFYAKIIYKLSIQN